jgi:hypothetical protein
MRQAVRGSNTLLNTTHLPKLIFSNAKYQGYAVSTLGSRGVRLSRESTTTELINTAPAATRPIAAPTASSRIRYSDTGQMLSKITQPITAYGYRRVSQRR